MIGIDTNVLVRYIAQDHATQSARATRLLEQECSPATPGFIGLVVLLELVSTHVNFATSRQMRTMFRN